MSSVIVFVRLNEPDVPLDSDTRGGGRARQSPPSLKYVLNGDWDEVENS